MMSFDTFAPFSARAIIAMEGNMEATIALLYSAQLAILTE